METIEIWKMLASFGGTGVLAFVMWQFAKQFINSFNEQVKERLASQETRTNICEADRVLLHAKIAEIQERNYRKDLEMVVMRQGQATNIADITKN